MMTKARSVWNVWTTPAALWLAAVPAAATGADAAPSEGSGHTDLAARADAVRATVAETAFHRIPWVTDLFEGFRVAKEEARPVFLYLITGDPLGDC